MAVRVTARRMSGGTQHQHISQVKWTNEATDKSDVSSRAEMVKYVDEHAAGAAYVKEGNTKVDVRSIHPSSGDAYIRTYADGTWKDNLLALPEF